jgi:release factor glutamine methyltransferase
VIAGDWLRVAEGKLRAAGAPYPSRDALLLLSDAVGRDKARVLAHPERALTGEEEERLEAPLARREGREPLPYIRGRHEFWGMRVAVGPGCLIPRPETEHLVEAALEALRGVASPRVADVGTGSGCLMLALARERPDAVVVGLDREIDAMAWARRNTRGVHTIHLLFGDLEGAPPLAGLDAIVSNPPYVTEEEWPGLPPEVRLFEPAAALRCGPDPLGPYRRLAAWSHAALKPGGFLLCELGVAQARRAAALRRLHPALTWVRGIRDLAGRTRVAVWRRK